MKIGKIFFAYVNPLDTYDDTIHSVEDEDVFSLRISQSETEFARARVEIRNPSIGLLAPGRKQRVFISCEHGPDKKLLFAGRLVGFPLDIGENTVSVEFIAQPEDWFNTQQAFLQTLKVAPFYNPLFIPEEDRDKAEEILAARAALLHWDRMTGQVVLSDILQGSQFLDIGDEFFFDSLETEIGDPPVSRIVAEIEVQWLQLGVGEVNCGEPIRREFTNTITASPQINTLTPLAFEAGWNGVRIPRGYELVESQLTPVADAFGLIQENLRSGLALVSGMDYPTKTGATPATRQVSIPRVWYEGRLFLKAEYSQKRREIMHTVVTSETQNVSLSSDRTELLTARLQDPTALTQDEVLDVGKPSFFYEAGDLTSYGRDAVEHIVLQAMARLKKAARAVEIQFDCAAEKILELTCDYTVKINDPRIPGAEAIGKVVGYTILIDGDTGSQFGQVKIACCLGTAQDSIGSGDPIDETSYDNVTGGPIQSAVFYELAAIPDIEIPVDVEAMETDDEYLIEEVIVEHSGHSQNVGWIAQAQPDVWLQDRRTRVEVELKSMNPEPELYAEVEIDCSTLTLPRHINLEAE